MREREGHTRGHVPWMLRREPADDRERTPRAANQSRHRLFFFKQKTAYEMSLRDWSSDVCSSDLSDCALRVIIALTPSHVANTAPATCRPVAAWPHPGRRSERRNAPIGRRRCVVSVGTTSAPVVTMGAWAVSGTWADRRTVELTDRRTAYTSAAPTARPPVRPSRSAFPAPRAPCSGARPARAARRPDAERAVPRASAT